MANTDFLQATIELFGAVITVVVAMIFLIITRTEKKSQKDLFALLLVSGFSMVLDAGWYAFDGSSTTVGFVINRLANFLIFLCNPVMLILTTRYVYNLVKEGGKKVQSILYRISYLLAGLVIMIPVSNLVFQWMYYIDEANVYHRMDGWYVYTGLNCVAILFCFITVLANRRLISTQHRIALYLFFLAPFLGIVLQALILGISFIQIGIAVSCIVIILCYLVDWIRLENNNAEISEDRKKIWLIECVFSIMILFISAAIITCVISLKNVANENSEQNSTSLAYMVSETVSSSLAEPITVSKTMAQSDIIVSALSMESLENTETEAKMLEFMQRIKEKYDYQMIFVASEKTKAYYTYEGLSRYMEVSADSKDSWYLDFKNRNREYELNIDADKDNNMTLAVFVNMEVRSSEGDLIGVCGVAKSMESLMDILGDYEDNYDLNITLTDSEGLVQVCTDRGKIETSVSDISYLDTESPETVSYTRISERAILAKQMTDLGWILLIEDNNPDKLDVFRIILPSMIIYVLGVILILVFSLVFVLRERRRSRELQKSKIESKTAQAESLAKGRFLANMSHEIRTPINAVLGMDTMILRESKEPQIKEYAMMIRNSGNILLSLINDILDISKIESGKMEIVPEEYDFSTLLADVMNMVSMKAEKKGLELLLEVDRDLPAGLYGDDVRIRQIIVNLLNNAVKYTENGSVTLRVSGETTEDIVRLSISVKDTGIGIKEEDLAKLYEDFVRIEEARNKKIEGTGLGMSITLQLLELMGSKLNVTSVYGEGSDFSFVLEQKIMNFTPLGDIALHQQKSAQEYEYRSLFTAPLASILVVDDNDVNRVVFVNLLKETKLQIDEADCGSKALESVFSKKYDIIFLDHMMPDMDGIEVLQRIKDKKDHPNTQTPVIVLTANAIAGAREEYLEAGFTNYLSKPIIPEHLERLIAETLPSDKINIGKREVLHDSINAMELPAVDGVDWYYAKLHLSDPEALLKTLQSFYASLSAEAEGLQRLYEDILTASDKMESLDLYRIKVHAMKSTSNLLGCVPIAGMAATLEKAAKTGNLEVIEALTPHFLKEWLEYKEKLDFCKAPEAEKSEVEDISLICDYLNQLRDAVLAFDVDGADSVLGKLRQYQFLPEAEAVMEHMAVAVNDLDGEKVSALCEAMKEKLQA